ncbi:diguanylate cyclase [Desulfuromonas acetoxidans]|uniref:diguanylate cyclase n=1 Tax=Desulfuromonas acetoxidans (strain DSM 684 / 11070) TaxID=281689 RepID=Q1K485_DESA6|nr:diguanylate cyclase [Desulfuromonas acetoxidans]EAT17218.1 diguanylate cyclase [Desulfuromonas acetoxidans DSM 684]MBF0645386.1 diguanylate cyclase [Desulfuromonas acetoxidans]NVD24192.1 diguanylate cyclase [Desulfuromonas acetoxidans]NVE15035.1 diguanylate cyclase [Desulfuromonas acetoxidans]
MSLLQARNVDILVVEDSYTQALKLEQLFEEEGLSVACADGASRALLWLENYRPALIISDVVMPDMDGFELCRQIKGHVETRHVPVVLLTRLSEPEDIVRGLECGADHFVTKPFDCSLLVSQVHNILLNQKIRSQQRNDDGVEIYFAGKKHVINSERSQILDLLLSTYEGALQQKRELERMNEQLNEALDTIKKRNAEIAELAVRDSLTGSFNRGYFNETFPGAIRRAQRYQQSLSLIMCDIDHFKLINDHYGHQTGDRVIKSVAQGLAQSLRQGVDWLARYGGEEFVIVLPETNLEGALVVAERMRRSIADQEIACDPQSIRLTASFGVAGCDPEHASMLTGNGMIAAADRCLYQAKKEGRNCCCSKNLK